MHRGERAADSESRRIYGFVESIEPPIPNNNYSRFALMLDAVDAASFDASPSALPQKNNLLIVRVISTPQRIFDLFNIELPQEGKWLELTLGRREGLPPAWVLNANDDYGGQVERTNVIAAQALPAAGEEPDNPHNLVARLEDSCTVKRKKTKTIKNVRAASSRVHIRMLDVGHASCAAIHIDRDSNSTIIGYFDTGAPVFFHRKTFPRFFTERPRVPDSGFVILSHWDFDHYALAVSRLKELQQLNWYAPQQKVGPNASAFQRKLGARLRFISRRIVKISNGLLLRRGTAPTTDRNNSGYALCLKQEREKILLTGDIGYEHIAPSLKSDLTGLSIPHHGGNGSARPPNGSGIAAVSYGSPNRYRHPNELNLAAHTSAGWTVKRTAAHGPSSRGDRWLTRP